VNRRHTGAAFSAAGFLWLFALLFVIVTRTPVRVLVSSFLLIAAAAAFAGLRRYQRRFHVAPKVWNPAAPETS
jgi:hypothetical protein